MGDIMILNFAKLLRKVVSLRYFVDRFDGDEFIVFRDDNKFISVVSLRYFVDRFDGDEFIVIAEDISGRLFRGTCPVCR